MQRSSALVTGLRELCACSLFSFPILLADLECATIELDLPWTVQSFRVEHLGQICDSFVLPTLVHEPEAIVRTELVDAGRFYGCCSEGEVVSSRSHSDVERASIEKERAIVALRRIYDVVPLSCERIVTSAAVQNVTAVPSVEPIVSVLSIKDIIAWTALDVVISSSTPKLIVAAVALHFVVSRSCEDLVVATTAFDIVFSLSGVNFVFPSFPSHDVVAFQIFYVVSTSPTDEQVVSWPAIHPIVAIVSI